MRCHLGRSAMPAPWLLTDLEMSANSYVDVDAAAPAAVPATDDGTAADPVSPRTPAAVRAAQGHGLGNETPMSPSK